MKLLALDPSSTRTGYALLAGPRELLDCGHVTPPSAMKCVVRRGLYMAEECRQLCIAHHPQHIIVEIPAPQAPKWAQSNRGQANYGVAVGLVLARTLDWVREHGPHSFDSVEWVQADVWTRRVKKAHRQLCVMSDFPAYSRNLDPGLDAADAIALGQYFFQRELTNAK